MPGVICPPNPQLPIPFVDAVHVYPSSLPSLRGLHEQQ